MVDRFLRREITNVGFCITVLLIACLSIVGGAYSASAQLIRDQSLGEGRGLPVGSGLDSQGAVDYLIEQRLGQLSNSGTNLFHSFSQFDIQLGETASFVGDGGVQNIIARVTGGNVSSVFGTIRSDIPQANLFLMNPSGWVFGEGSSIDVSGDFHMTTAPEVQFGQGPTFDAQTTDASLLSFDPVSFGFVGGLVGNIEIRDAEIDMNGKATLSGSNISVEDSRLVTHRMGLGLYATGEGSVTLALDDSISDDLDGQISIMRSVVQTDLDSRATTSVDPGDRLFLTARARNIELTQSTWRSGDPGLDSSRTATRFANSLIASNELIVSDSSVESVQAEVGTLDSFDAGLPVTLQAPNMRLENSLFNSNAQRLNNFGFINSAGFDLVGDAIEIVGSSIDTSVASVSGGVTSGAISLSELGSLAADSRRLVISGSSFETVTDSDNSFTGAITIDMPNADGRIGGFGGRSTLIDASSEGYIGGTRNADIIVRLGSLELNDALVQSVSTTESFFSFGEISFDIGGDARIGSGALISTNASIFGLLGAEPGTRGNPISIVSGGNLVVAGARILSTTEVTNAFGAADNLTLEGAAIQLSGNRVSISGASEIATSGIGLYAGAGDIVVNATDSIKLNEAKLSARSELDAGGEVLLSAGSKISVFDSEVSTAVGGAGEGGNVDLSSDTVVTQSSLVSAQAVEGAGGNITISAKRFIADDTVFNASSAFGSDGDVNINSPDVNLDSGLTPLNASFSDPSTLLRPTCAARASGGGEIGGRFVVAPRRGLPPSPEGLLLALEDLPEASRVPSVPSGPRTGAGGKSLDLAMAMVGEGQAAFRGGSLSAASQRLEAASEIFASRGAAEEASQAYRLLAQSQHAQGLYVESVAPLRKAVAAARQAGDEEQLASSLGGLGTALGVLGETERARSLLGEALGIVLLSGNKEVAGKLANNLGNQHTIAEDHGGALEAYLEAARLAASSGSPLHEAKAWANAGRSALELREFARAVDLVDRARERIAALESSHEKAFLEIHVARTLLRLTEQVAAAKAPSLLAAHSALHSAHQIGVRVEDASIVSYALGNLGALYELEQRTNEALYYTRKALLVSEKHEISEASSRWHWQEGRLLWSSGQAEAAVQAYERAVNVLEGTRPETLARYGDGAAHFRNSVAPVYLALVGALLDGASLLEESRSPEALLVQARNTVEQLKAAELRNYLRDECVLEMEEKEVALSEVSGSAAVVYPILLPDRIELLVNFSSKLERYVVRVPSHKVESTISELRQKLRRRLGHSYRAPAQDLYEWLVKPYLDDLRARSVDTIVMIPDGGLRSVPFAALYDGTRFLVEQYALAVTPSFRLIDPRPLKTENARLLIAGASDFSQFPVSKFQDITLRPEDLLEVPEEVRQLQELMGGTLLLDESFEMVRFTSELERLQPTIVHIASHAQFRGAADQSYLLTPRGRITMDQLSSIIEKAKFRKEPLELLTLSACETAAGDDRASLGLAGVAIKAGARSVVGSLWNISDAATRKLILHFYRALREQGVSKAEALRRAQLALIEDGRFEHPYYWSPFLVINNWL